MGFPRQSDIGSDGFHLKYSKLGNLDSQELTINYLCENSELGLPVKDITRKTLADTFKKVALIGKEVSVSKNSHQGDKWVKKDFLNLTKTKGNSLKQLIEDNF